MTLTLTITRTPNPNPNPNPNTGATLAAWPSIPAAACVEGGFAALGQGWWRLLVLGVYNVLDFAARLRLRRLQAAAHRLHGRRLLALCALRLALPPLVYICVRPRLVRGGWGNGVILA